MPQIINPYKPGPGLGDDLFGIGGLTDTFFGPKAATSAYTREKFKEQQRQNISTEDLANLLANPTANPGAIAAAGIRAGIDPKNAFGYRSGANIARMDPTQLETPASQALITQNLLTQPGANYVSTPQGQASAQANTQAIAALQAEKAKETQIALDARTNMPAYDANGNPVIVLKSNAPGMRPVLPLEQEKAAELRRLGVFGGGAPASAAPAWPAPGAPADTSIMTAPITDASVFAPSLAAPPARPPISPDARIALGLDPKTQDGDNIVIYNAAGEKLRSYISLDNGRTDDAGNPITLGPGEQKVIVGKTNPNVGTGGSTGPRDKLLESRIAHRTLMGSVDNMIKALDKPGADAALGIVGQGATIIDNLRAQADALTGAAKDLGFGQYADKFNASAQQYYDQTPGLKQWAEARNIDRSVMQSRMSSLAYAMARADDPRGDISNKAVDSKMAELGAKLQNPAAFKTVLQDLKARSELQQRIREEETTRILPPNTLPAAGAAATAGAAPPPAAGAAPPPPPGFVLQPTPVP
jgi:hypothetical protein